jgi:hypothetical protein
VAKRNRRTDPDYPRRRGVSCCNDRILHQYNTENFQPSDLDGFSQEGNLQRQSLTAPQDPCAGLNPSFNPFMRVSQEINGHINAIISKLIEMLGISCPIFFSPQHQACLRSHITRTGLRGSLIYHETSSSLATAAANRIGMCACQYSPQAFSCDDDPAMVLSVDYTNVALTIHTFRNFLLMARWRHVLRHTVDPRHTPPERQILAQRHESLEIDGCEG